MPRHEIPLQRERIQTNAVGSTSALHHQKNRYDIHRIFEPSFEKSRTHRIGKNPPITQSDVPDAGARVAPVESMPAAGPNLQFLAVVGRRTSLGPRGMG